MATPTLDEVTAKLEGVVSSVTVDNVPGGTDKMYVIVGHFYTTNPATGNDVISSISGGGLTYAKVTGTRGCSGRIAQPRIETWWAFGSPSTFNMVVTLADTTLIAGAHIAVCRIDGAENTAPINGEFANTNGEDGPACGGGADNDSPTFGMTVSNANSLIIHNVHPRNGFVSTKDTDYTAIYNVQNKDGGSASTIDLYSRGNPPTGTDTISETLNGNKAWVAGAVEVKEAVELGKPFPLHMNRTLQI